MFPPLSGGEDPEYRVDQDEVFFFKNTLRFFLAEPKYYTYQSATLFCISISSRWFLRQMDSVTMQKVWKYGYDCAITPLENVEEIVANTGPLKRFGHVK